MKNKLVVNADLGEAKISRFIYGHFAEHLGRCIYEGFWVGEDSDIPNTEGIRNDVVEALRRAEIPVLRWPGGCFADDYHWKDGIGERNRRPKRINTHWGRVEESNHFGTHEFFALCSMLGAEPYICGNVGSGSVREMKEWIEYMTFPGDSELTRLRTENGRRKPWKLRFFGVGNENWGCGGQMRPEYYADLYRRYQTYVRDFGENEIYRIACGPNRDDYRWTEVLMERAASYMEGLSLHYYTSPPESLRSATGFSEKEWFGVLRNTLKMDELIDRHTAIMDRYDPEERIKLIVDEWGSWYEVEKGTEPRFLYQQNTLRDALVAGINLNIFNRNCQRVHMANIAQTVNVLQAMVLTDGPQMLTTPTYHVFEMYKVHHDATLVPINLESEKYRLGEEMLPMLNASASKNENGELHLSICNLHAEQPADIDCELRGASLSRVEGRILTADQLDAHNTFDARERVKPEIFEGARLDRSSLRVEMPPASVVVVKLV